MNEHLSVQERLHSIEVTLGTLEWITWSLRSAILCLMPEGSKPRAEMVFTENGFEYLVHPQLPVPERNALIMLWHGQGKTIKEIQFLLYARGHATKKGVVIRADTIQKVIDNALSKGGDNGDTGT